jgi:hypothetical protein
MVLFVSTAEQLDCAAGEGVPGAVEVGAVADEQHKEHEGVGELEAEGGGGEAQEEDGYHQGGQPKTKNLDPKCIRKE